MEPDPEKARPGGAAIGGAGAGLECDGVSVYKGVSASNETGRKRCSASGQPYPQGPGFAADLSNPRDSNWFLPRFRFDYVPGR